MDVCLNSCLLLTVNTTHGRSPSIYGQGEGKDNETEGRKSWLESVDEHCHGNSTSPVPFSHTDVCV